MNTPWQCPMDPPYPPFFSSPNRIHWCGESEVILWCLFSGSHLLSVEVWGTLAPVICGHEQKFPMRSNGLVP
jgi:hypothetical protein